MPTNGTIKEPLVEDLLSRLHIGFRFLGSSIRLADIDLQLSLRNPTRRDRPSDLEVVDHYRRLLVAGRPFKPIVLASLPEGKYLCHGGIHRLQACLSAKISAWKYGAYVVDETDPVRIDLVVGLLNTIEGKGATKSQQVELAAGFIGRHPDWTPETVAKLYGVSKNAVANKLQQINILQRIDRLGGDLGYIPPQS